MHCPQAKERGRSDHPPFFPAEEKQILPPSPRYALMGLVHVIHRRQPPRMMRRRAFFALGRECFLKTLLEVRFVIRRLRILLFSFVMEKPHS